MVEPAPRPGRPRRPLAAAAWLWDLLTTPSRRIRAPERRRRSAMLAGLLLFLLAAAGALTWLLPWLVAPAEHAANRELALTGAGVFAAGSAIYLLSRTRYSEAAAWLVVFTTMAAVTASTYISQGTIWLDGSPYFLALSLILAGVLLPIAATLVIATLTLLLPLVFYLTIPSFSAPLLAGALTFLGATAALLLVAALLHDLDLRQIHRQAAELREREARHRALFEASFEALVLHDGGRILDVNHAVAETWGHNARALRGMRLEELVVTDSRAHLLQSVTATHHSIAEAVARRADGATFPVEFITKPYIFRGRLIHATALRDITARKESEAAREKARELQTANERLLEIERLKTHILNVTSHELNTPMTPLRMQIHLLKNRRYGKLNDRQERAVYLLDRNVQRLGVLVRDILDVSRLESGRLRIAPEPLELGTAAADAIAAFSETAHENGVELRLHAPGQDAWVHADPVRIHQVLTNLISNALKFTPRGGLIELTVRHDAQGHVEVRVRDTGLGFSAAQRARLFRPFEQVHDVRRTLEPGTGLGLFISKELIESHGGTLDADSAGEGQGSTFTFRLPAGRAPPRAEADPGGQEAPGRQPAPPLRRAGEPSSTGAERGVGS